MSLLTKIIIISVALLLRAATSLHGYSGQNKPPLHGDFEAQRHWQEITVNLQVQEWYENSTDNDLLYWGLDYPPLTAYHSFLCGKIASYINENYIKLHSSRGLEDGQHKLFMRHTVLVADLLIFIPAITYFFKIFNCLYSNGKNAESNEIIKSASLIMTLFYPGLILIDNGHFQYNNISLGLAILAVAYLMKNEDYKASIAFVLALNYKQMELYHAFPIFVYLLAGNIHHKSKISGLFKVLKLGAVVILTFVVLWLPFIWNLKIFTQVLHRIFPFARGIFEDKVSNVWCAVNVLVKLRTLFDTKQLATLCTVTTLISIIPSNLMLFIYPNKINLKYSLFTTSLSFFLFSFQVHEKSILLAALPALLLFKFEPLFVYWFSYISCFSMLPLLIKDQLYSIYLVLNVFYAMIFVWYSLIYHSGNIHDNIFTLSWSLRSEGSKSRSGSWILKLLFHISIISTVILTFSSVLIKPPEKYPDIFTLLISVISCLHFLMFLLYFSVKLFCINLKKNDTKCQ